MKSFKSIKPNCSVTAEQMAEIFEMYASGESFEAIAQKYQVSNLTASNYIHKYYLGIVPKHRQKIIVLQSAINEK